MSLSPTFSPKNGLPAAAGVPMLRIRKTSHLRSAPWCVITPATSPLRMVGCLGFMPSDYPGQWLYPFRTQQLALAAALQARGRAA